MTHLDQLKALRDAVRDGVWPGWADTPMGWDTNLLWKAYNRDMNAALALFAALLPGRAGGITFGGGYEASASVADLDAGFPHRATAPDPARALLLAMLEALIKKEEG